MSEREAQAAAVNGESRRGMGFIAGGGDGAGCPAAARERELWRQNVRWYG